MMSPCEPIGLHPAIGSGVHLRPADGLFAQFLRVYGVPEPEPVPSPKRRPRAASGLVGRSGEAPQGTIDDAQMELRLSSNSKEGIAVR